MEIFFPTEDQVIVGCVSEDTAYVVDNYPYGSLRTEKRYWVESVLGKGDRSVEQTKNPKTGRWNKPKKSTYTVIKVMYLEEQEDGRLFVKFAGVGNYAPAEKVQEAIALLGGPDLISVEQRRNAARAIGVSRVMEHVTFSVHEGPVTPEHEAEQVRIQGNIARAMAGASAQALKELS